MFPGYAVFLTNPSAQVDELAAFRTERTEGIIFPVDRSSAGWTIHEAGAAVSLVASISGAGLTCEPFGTLNQDSSIDKFDRAFTAHRVQPNGNAFSR